MPACARPGTYVPRQTHDCDNLLRLAREDFATALAREALVDRAPAARRFRRRA